MVNDDGSSVTSSPLQCFSMMSLSPTAVAGPPWLRELKSDERGLYLIHLLLNCATHVAAGSLEHANAALEHISLLASPDGDTMQRIASYFTSALACRILRQSWPGLYRALHSSTPPGDAAAARHHFLRLFPFLSLAFVVSNQAIMEAMEGEKIIHIVDLNAADPTQWLALLQALSNRPEGPPHLRITGINEHKHILTNTAMRLTEEAEKLDVPFQFNPVVTKLENLDLENLRVKTGEALAISSVLHLHCLLASNSADSGITRNATSRMKSMEELFVKGSPRMESFLGSLWGLSPKIVVVTEQETNHNGPTLNERFVESLNFYAALFDCMESTVSRQSAERTMVEKMVFGEEIKNIIACEGLERLERHEKLERWVPRLDLAGFGRVPLSYYGLLQARTLLQSFGCEGYKVKEENGCFVICWQDRALFSVSAWSCRRYD